MTEDVRHLWVLSMSNTAFIPQSMIELTGLAVKSSEQHVEMGNTRQSRDHKDCQTFVEWLKPRNPFLFEDNHLHLISLGFISDEHDEINYE